MELVELTEFLVKNLVKKIEILLKIATLTIITSFEFNNSVLIDIHIYSILINSRILSILLSKSFL